MKVRAFESLYENTERNIDFFKITSEPVEIHLF